METWTEADAAGGRAPSTRSRSRRRSRRSTGRSRILKVLADGEGMSLTELAEATGQAPATVYRVLSTLRGARDRRGAAGDAALVRRAGGVPHRQRLSRADEPRRAGARGDARADGGDRRDGEPRHRRRRAGGVHQPGRDARADPGVLPAGHARADPCQRHRQGAARLSAARGGGADRARAGAARPSRARTITDPGRLAEELAAIRARGWAVDDEERTEGMRCIAAPIFNEFREAMAGVSISGPTGRMDARRGRSLGERVRAAADRITRAIGGTAL